MESNSADQKRSSLVPDSMLVLAVLAWAVSYPIAKQAMDEWGHGAYRFSFLAGRFWLALAIFAPLAVRQFFRGSSCLQIQNPGFGWAPRLP